MPTDETDVNPYESPTTVAVQDAVPVAEASQPRRRFRWRVIPVTLLYIYGGSAFLGGVGQLGVFAWMLAFRSNRIPDNPLVIGGFLCGSVAGLLAGCAFIFVGRSLWTGQWWRAGLVFFLGIVAAVALASVAWLVGLLP